MKFTSNKVIDLGSTAFRQWRSTHSHCQYVHGYNLTANITFEADKLDDKGWVADFGGLKTLKQILEYTFDHKLVVAGDDPQIDLLKLLDEAGVAQVVVLEGGVGCERFAEFVLKTADTFIDEETEGRVRVKSVQINEHGKNFATAHRTVEVSEDVRFAATFTQSDSKPSVEDSAVLEVTFEDEGLQDVHGPIAGQGPSDYAEPKEKEFKGSEDQATPVKPSTKTKGGWFEGTTWG